MKKVSSREFKDRFELHNGRYVEKDARERSNKFNAQKVRIETSKGDRTFDSTIESVVAIRLDWFLHLGYIRDWEPQVPFKIPGKTGKKRRQQTHRVDFKVILKNGKEIFIEIKDHEHQDGETRRHVVEEIYGIEIIVCKRASQVEAQIIKHSKEAKEQCVAITQESNRSPI